MNIQAGAKAALLGRCVVINGIISTPELNGCKGSALSFDHDKARFKVKLHETLDSKNIVLLKAYNLSVLSVVVVNGLVSKPELNGRKGTVLSFDDVKARYNVKLHDASDSIIQIKACNLSVSSLKEDVRNGAGSMLAAQSCQSASAAAAAGSSNTACKVAEMHLKYHMDAAWLGARGKFAGDKVFSQGISAVVGPMPTHLLRFIYYEHMQSSDSGFIFVAWNAGLKIETTPRDEWLFVVGEEVCSSSSHCHCQRCFSFENHKYKI